MTTHDLFVVGVSHHDCPVRVREQLAVPQEHVGTVLNDLRQLGSASELLLLSTCNRVEIYGVGPVEQGPHGIINAWSQLAAESSRYTY